MFYQNHSSILIKMALYSKQTRFTIMAFILILFFVLISLPYSTSVSTDASAYLRISPTEFMDSTKDIITIIQNVSSILPPFTNVLEHSPLSDPIFDCLHLLEMSSEHLSWCISATQNPKDNRGTGNLSPDLRTWLSAVLVNSDTCMEGVEGTSVEGLVSRSLDPVTSMVKKLLAEVIPSDQPAAATNSDGFPSWFTHDDRKILKANALPPPDVVVAADGSGDYRNVTDAVSSAPDYNFKRYVIYVKKGVYAEYVVINKEKWNIMIIGDGIDATVITGSRNYVDGYKTFNSATFAVNAVRFIACNISFQNTAGPNKEQAVALRSDSDLSVFYRCGIFGYQDSLYPHSMRQFYKECRIAGTVDFIFGDATAVFQNCQILAKQGTPSQKNTITAQGRIDPDQPTGFSFQFCNISADYDLQPTTQTYLGRPWKNYSRTIFMQSYMSDVINPKGWLEMDGNKSLNTLSYGEYKNSGPGAKVADRVKWSGYHIYNESEAQKFTVDEFIEGDLWLPSTGVNYTAGF